MAKGREVQGTIPICGTSADRGGVPSLERRSAELLAGFDLGGDEADLIDA
jgi:hypothetical protein